MGRDPIYNTKLTAKARSDGDQLVRERSEQRVEYPPLLSGETFTALIDHLA